MIQQGNIDIVGDLPIGVIVYDLSFDWTGRRLAATCSDRTIKMFVKKGDKWTQQDKNIKISGAAAWKVKWARPQFGTIIATCSLDTQIRIYELKKIEQTQGLKYQWIPIHIIQQNKAIQDIKFATNRMYGLCLAIASSDGSLKILMAENPLKLKQWSSNYIIQVNPFGIGCLSWSKNLLKQDESIIAVGCKNLESSPKKMTKDMKVVNNSVIQQQEKLQSTSTVAFVNFNRNSNSKPLQKINVPKIRQTKTINDISWSLMNGRSYYLLGIASQSFIKIFELSIKDSLKDLPVIDVLRQLVLSNQPCMRLSWNVMGTYLSGSQKKKIRVWRCLSRGVWNQIKQIESS